MIQYIKKAGMWVAISTNGTLLTEDNSRKLFKTGVDKLFLSFDSLIKDVYEKLRSGASFYQVLENIERCLTVRKSRNTFKTYIELQIIEMKDNFNEIGNYKKYFKSKIKDVGEIVAKPYDYFAGTVENLSAHPRVEKEEKFVCTMCNYSMTIEWNGDANICCRDYDNFTLIGNVHKQSIKEIWDSLKYEQIRQAHKDRDFTKLKYCRGCYLASEGKTVNYHRVRNRLEQNNLIPLLNQGTIYFLESVLTKDTEVLETGSGASTVWFAERVKNVISWEDLTP